MGSRLFVNSDVSFNQRFYVGSDVSLGGNLFINRNTGIGKAPAYVLDVSGISRTTGSILFGTLPTTKYYNWSGSPSVSTISSPSVTLNFGNGSFYAKIHCFLSDASTNNVSSQIFEVQGGNVAGTTPANNISEISRISTISGYYTWNAPTYTTTNIVLTSTAATGVVFNYIIRVELIQTNVTAANVPTLNSITMINNNSGGTTVTNFSY
jgi:hypothetical protein